MRHSRSYPNVIRRWYRPVEHECPECHRTLREAVAVSRRTVITLQGVIKLNHAGYRCPDPQCVGHARTYRSVWFSILMTRVVSATRSPASKQKNALHSK